MTSDLERVGEAAAAELRTAAELRRQRPELTIQLAEHACSRAVATADDLSWVRAAGWMLAGHAVGGDAREAAVVVVEALADRGGPALLYRPDGARLRVELATAAQSDGDTATARALLADLPDPGPGEADGQLRLDRLAVEARCALAEEHDDQLPVLCADIGRAGDALGGEAAAYGRLVVGAVHRARGQHEDAAAAALRGLEFLGWTPENPDVRPVAPHLAAALLTQWLTASLDAGADTAEAVRAVAGHPEILGAGRHGVLLRLTLARAAGADADAAAVALDDAVAGAAAADVPGLVASCRAAQSELHEVAGRFAEALGALRASVDADREDRERSRRFRAALAGVTRGPVRAPAPVADSPAASLRARARHLRAHGEPAPPSGTRRAAAHRRDASAGVPGVAAAIGTGSVPTAASVECPAGTEDTGEPVPSLGDVVGPTMQDDGSGRGVEPDIAAPEPVPPESVSPESVSPRSLGEASVEPDPVGRPPSEPEPGEDGPSEPGVGEQGPAESRDTGSGDAEAGPGVAGPAWPVLGIEAVGAASVGAGSAEEQFAVLDPGGSPDGGSPLGDMLLAELRGTGPAGQQQSPERAAGVSGNGDVPVRGIVIDLVGPDGEPGTSTGDVLTEVAERIRGLVPPSGTVEIETSAVRITLPDADQVTALLWSRSLAAHLSRRMRARAAHRLSARLRVQGPHGVEGDPVLQELPVEQGDAPDAEPRVAARRQPGDFLSLPGVDSLFASAAAGARNGAGSRNGGRRHASEDATGRAVFDGTTVRPGSGGRRRAAGSAERRDVAPVDTGGDAGGGPGAPEAAGTRFTAVDVVGEPRSPGRGPRDEPLDRDGSRRSSGDSRGVGDRAHGTPARDLREDRAAGSWATGSRTGEDGAGGVRAAENRVAESGAAEDLVTPDRATAGRSTADRATADRATADRATADRATEDRAAPEPIPDDLGLAELLAGAMAAYREI
ncbi:hypothetical protein [Pseudonocardia phyllosphaerae]|uniref:hypothetical protein n=1 Tax=Pseudonocardia phyllosphaerae TaxID=3390502 RepID=UPI0039784D87